MGGKTENGVGDGELGGGGGGLPPCLPIAHIIPIII